MAVAVQHLIAVEHVRHLRQFGCHMLIACCTNLLWPLPCLSFSFHVDKRQKDIIQAFVDWIRISVMEPRDRLDRNEFQTYSSESIHVQCQDIRVADQSSSELNMPCTVATGVAQAVVTTNKRSWVQHPPVDYLASSYVRQNWASKHTT